MPVDITFGKRTKEHQFDQIEIICKNKTEIPEKKFQIQNREMCSTIFRFQKDRTLATYMVHKNKAVLILSTLYHEDKIESSSCAVQCL